MDVIRPAGDEQVTCPTCGGEPKRGEERCPTCWDGASGGQVPRWVAEGWLSR